MSQAKRWTKQDFQAWVARARDTFRRDSPPHQNSTTREWADRIRPFDARLADLYVRSAEANEAIREHLLRSM